MNQPTKKRFPYRKMPFERYKPFPRINLPNRKWPSRLIDKAPIWCSVDLRDGNQALVNPMSVSQKLIYFSKLVEIGFKEIEVGFPAASATEFEFMRRLIENNYIPDDVTIQILCQARPALIEKTVESLKGCKKAIFHLYNSTSTLQRKVVFNSDRAGIKKIAVDGTICVKEAIKKIPECSISFQYSPESFTSTELDYALEVVEEVTQAWQPDIQNKIIINLPATVEVCPPNIYADMIEWMINNLSQRDKTIVSLHTHNDRGCGIAASELALMAGAERIEGTLFGNGERTGNADIVILACNLYSQGIDPHLDFSDIDGLAKFFTEVTDMEIHPRHPYCGSLVYTAFSGSHQDAINKGMNSLEDKEHGLWEVPYLPIDPRDLGRVYEPIRINSQSGKGGVAFILSYNFGYQLPKKFHRDLSDIIQVLSEKSGKEVPMEVIKEKFEGEFVNMQSTLKMVDFRMQHTQTEAVELNFTGEINGEIFNCTTNGNGPLDALSNALKQKLGFNFEIEDYVEHTMGKESNAKAACYIGTKINDVNFLGVGVHYDISRASFLALISCINRYIKTQG